MEDNQKADFCCFAALFQKKFNQPSGSNPPSAMNFKYAWTLHRCKCETNVRDGEKFISLSQATTSI